MVTIERTSPFTGKKNTLALNISMPEFNAGMRRWLKGAYSQDAFPTLNADEREFIKTGIHPSEFPNEPTDETCLDCDRVTDDLNDDGRCESCQLDHDIRRAEYARDLAEDR